MQSPIDIDYLEQTDTDHPDRVQRLLTNQHFLSAQSLFFRVVSDLHGTVNFEIADMREVHIVAALGDVKDLTILDVGCGSTEQYAPFDPLDFRNRYPPFLAEMLQRKGAKVTGIDSRPNPKASYDHRVVGLADPLWTTKTDPPYDIIACLAVVNAPQSPFERNEELTATLFNQMSSLLKPDGLLIATLPEMLFHEEQPLDRWKQNAEKYVKLCGLDVLFCGRSMLWACVNSHSSSQLSFSPLALRQSRPQ